MSIIASLSRSLVSRPAKKLVSIMVHNNEQIGIHTEKMICESHKIDFKTKRKQLLQMPIEASLAISNDIKHCALHIPPVERHIGGLNQAFDFQLHDGRFLSVKSLYNSNRVAPQNIGQASASRLKTVLNIEFDDFKEYFLAHKEYLMHQYVQNLFKQGLLLVINYKHGRCYMVDVPNTNNVGLKVRKHNHFNTSRTLDMWNESNTIYLVNPESEDKKHRKITIGEVQVHSNRSCCKFRFNIENLVAHDLVEGINITTIELKHKYKIKTIPLQLKDQGHF